MLNSPAHKAFDELWVAVLELAAIVEPALRDAANAFIDRRVDLADRVKAVEPEIDRLEVRIEEACLRALALYQPVASDLRRVFTVLKVNVELEELGDLALNVAKRVRKLAAPVPAELAEPLEDLADRALIQVRDSLDALTGGDAQAGRAIRARDRDLVRNRRKLVKRIKLALVAAPHQVDHWLMLINTARNLERVSTHARNIAESAVYLFEGKIIRHGPLTA